jgi:hypothetical protein
MEAIKAVLPPCPSVPIGRLSPGADDGIRPVHSFRSPGSDSFAGPPHEMANELTLTLASYYGENDRFSFVSFARFGFVR